MKKQLATHCHVTGIDQIPVCHRFQHVSGRASSERLELVLLAVIHGEDQDPRRESTTHNSRAACHPVMRAIVTSSIARSISPSRNCDRRCTVTGLRDNTQPRDNVDDQPYAPVD